MKSNDRHAAYRMAERYGEDHIDALRLMVEGGTFQYLRRQTNTRTICRAVVGADDVYFILDKNTKRIVTVLTPEQAREHLL